MRAFVSRKLVEQAALADTRFGHHRIQRQRGRALCQYEFSRGVQDFFPSPVAGLPMMRRSRVLEDTHSKAFEQVHNRHERQAHDPRELLPESS